MATTDRGDVVSTRPKNAEVTHQDRRRRDVASFPKPSPTLSLTVAAELSVSMRAGSRSVEVRGRRGMRGPPEEESLQMPFVQTEVACS
jgi:hypothetical protein